MYVNHCPSLTLSDAFGCNVIKNKNIGLLTLVSASFLYPWHSPGQNTGVGSHSLLQGNLPNPGMQPGFPALQADSLRLSLQGSPTLTFLHRAPKTLDTSWAASSFSQSFIVNPLQACLSMLGPRWIHDARGGAGGC